METSLHGSTAVDFYNPSWQGKEMVCLPLTETIEAHMQLGRKNL